MKRIFLIAPLFSLALVACPAYNLGGVPYLKITNLPDGDDTSRNCTGGIEAKLSFAKGSNRHELTSKAAFDKNDGANIPGEWILAGTEITVEAKCFNSDNKLLFSTFRKGTIPSDLDTKSTISYGLAVYNVSSIKSKEAIDKFSCYDQFDPKKISLCIPDTTVYGLTTPAK